MRCDCFQGDPATVAKALADSVVVASWQAHTASELPSLADGRLIAHLKRLVQIASGIQTIGLAGVQASDAAGVDAWLSDAFALATWEGWDLPVTRLGKREVDLAERPRGLFGVDSSTDGVTLVVIDTDVIALGRNREADERADLSQHPRSS